MTFVPKCVMAIFNAAVICVLIMAVVVNADCATTETTNKLKSCTADADCAGHMILGLASAPYCDPWAAYIAECKVTETSGQAAGQTAAMKSATLNLEQKCKDMQTDCSTATGACTSTAPPAPTTKSAAYTTHGSIAAVMVATVVSAIFIYQL